MPPQAEVATVVRAERDVVAEAAQLSGGRAEKICWRSYSRQPGALDLRDVCSYTELEADLLRLLNGKARTNRGGGVAAAIEGRSTTNLLMMNVSPLPDPDRAERPDDTLCDGQTPARFEQIRFQSIVGIVDVAIGLDIRLDPMRKM